MLPIGGRKPVDVLALRPKPSGQDAVWGVLRAALRAPPMTVREIARAARTDTRTARSYLVRLAAAGIVTAEGEDPVRYRLARDPGPETPRYRPDGTPVRPVSARQQIWNALKVHKFGDAATIAREASVGIGVARVDAGDARHYLGYLFRAGYLRVEGGGRGGHKGRAVYRLIRDTGPDAPMIQRLRRIWDPNLKQVVWAGEPSDERG